MKVVVHVPIDDPPGDGDGIIGKIANRMGLTRHMAKRRVAKAVREAVQRSLENHRWYLFQAECIDDPKGHHLMFTEPEFAHGTRKQFSMDNPLHQLRMMELEGR